MTNAQRLAEIVARMRYFAAAHEQQEGSSQVSEWADEIEAALPTQAQRDFYEVARQAIEPLREALCDGLVLVRGWHSDGTAWSDYDTTVENKMARAHDLVWRLRALLAEEEKHAVDDTNLVDSKMEKVGRQGDEQPDSGSVDTGRHGPGLSASPMASPPNEVIEIDEDGKVHGLPDVLAALNPPVTERGGAPNRKAETSGAREHRETEVRRTGGELLGRGCSSESVARETPSNGGAASPDAEGPHSSHPCNPAKVNAPVTEPKRGVEEILLAAIFYSGSEASDFVRSELREALRVYREEKHKDDIALDGAIDSYRVANAELSALKARVEGVIAWGEGCQAELEKRMEVNRAALTSGNDSAHWAMGQVSVCWAVFLPRLKAALEGRDG